VLGNQRSGRYDAQRREVQLGSFEISRVVGDDGLRVSGDRQLDKMIVGLIGQVRSPQVVQRAPRAAADEQPATAQECGRALNGVLDTE
jgi:hypothetical protein